MRKFTLLKSRTAAVVTGSLVVVGLGATGATAANLVDSGDIRNGSIRGVDIANHSVDRSEIRDGSLGFADLGRGVQNRLRQANGDEIRALDEEINGNQGLQHRVTALEEAPQVQDVLGGLAGQNQNDPLARTTIRDIGGSVRNDGTGQGVTPVTSIDLDEGTYLVSAYGHFDRLNANEANYVAPTTDTYGALVLWTGDEQFVDFLKGAGTYFTGAISHAGYTEATASGSQLLTVTEPTTLHVGGFGYNENRSGFGSETDASGTQFSVFARVAAVKVATAG